MEMHEYVNILVAQIRSKKAGKMVADEIYAHMEDQALAYEKEGMDRECARREAVRQMGDPVEAGVALDRIHRPRMDFKTLLAVLILSAVGLLLQYQGLRIAGWEAAGYNENLFYTSCGITLVEIVCMIGICFLDYTIVYQYAPFLYVLLTAVAWFGCLYRIFPEENGGFVYLGQYIYLFLPIYGALLYKLRGCGYGALFCCAGFIISLMFAIKPFFYLSYTGHFGIAALLMTSLAINRGWFRGNRKWMYGLVWGAPITAVSAFIIHILQKDGYQAERIKAILRMQSEASGYYEYYVGPIRQILGRLQWLGTSDAEEIWKELTYTAVQTSNMNLLYLFLSQGILIGLLILAVYLLFCGYLMKMCLRQKNELGRLVGFGCIVLLLIEAFDYVLVSFGLLLPGNSVIPFLQPGRVGTIVYYFLAGILLSIYRHQDILPANPGKSKATVFSKYRIVFGVEKVQKEQHKMS